MKEKKYFWETGIYINERTIIKPKLVREGGRERESIRV
jgi:hypothetical protein